MMSHWSLRLRVFLFFLFLALASIALIAGGLWFGWSRATPRPEIGPFVLGGIIAGFAVTGVVVWIWRLFDENLAHPMQALAAQMRVLAAGKGGKPLSETEAQYLGDLAPAAQAISERLAETQSDLTLAIQRETQRLASEKERLEALLADVSVGVLLCSADHVVVFYNSMARGFFVDGVPPRLDQPVTQALREGPLLHAYAQLTLPEAARSETSFLCATVDGKRMFSAHMRLAPQGNDRAGGYVLTLRDVTADRGAELARESLLSDMVDDMRRRAANIETLVALRDTPDATEVTEALVNETGAFAGAVERFASRFEQTRAEALAGRAVAARDLADGLRARLRGQGVELDMHHGAQTLAADGLMMVALIEHLVTHLAGSGRAGDLAMDVVAEETGSALVTLDWSGAPLDMSDLESWLDSPLDIGEGTTAARFVLTRHGTDLWSERTATGGRICLPLRMTEALPDHDLRGAVYDFSLFERARVASLADTPIEALNYVVFDTETTGLLPSQGDEIVQIAALRVVGARIVEGEAIDRLVDPGRDIPVASTKVHGITPEMVAGQPGIEHAGAELHDFARGAVLVAHNAPFDMAFFHKHADLIGREFDNPVMDTVLLSAVLFGITEDHTLDALCARLGITIPEHLRHTAMGDTRATAEAFVQMLGMLRARGFETFGAVHDEMKKQMRLYRRN